VRGLPPPPEAAGGPVWRGGGAPRGGGGVEVLSREPVGPYDRAILDARNVEDLRMWLNENGYQIPDDTDEKLRPYVDQGAVFVAIKLLPGEDVGDIVPLHLSFPGTTPTIPIVPTSVAASPDMGSPCTCSGRPGRAPELPARAGERGRHRLALTGQNYARRGRPGGGRGRRAGLRHGLTPGA
jgi:hypothetical protein